MPEQGTGCLATDRIVTIDGPSGAGKGTVARRVAAELDWHLLDSGALYRLVAHAALSTANVSFDDSRRTDADRDRPGCPFGADLRGEEQIWLAGEEVSNAIRSEQAGDGASRVAAIPGGPLGADSAPARLCAATGTGGRRPRHGYRHFPHSTTRKSS